MNIIFSLNPKFPSRDEWIKKERCICEMDYDSTIKKNTEGIVLSEINPTEEEKSQI